LSVLKLDENKRINALNFKIEGSAISKIPLIQNEWNTKPLINDIVLEDWKIVNTITWTELKLKYNMNFNVLVVDCEGALYYIFQDEPNMLQNIKTIIMENDYHDITHKQYIDEYDECISYFKNLNITFKIFYLGSLLNSDLI
jgi:hypothetical protein